MKQVGDVSERNSYRTGATNPVAMPTAKWFNVRLPLERERAMHEYRRFIQQELKARRWRQADLARATGLTPQHVGKILNDRREHLGQMPDELTLTKLAAGMGLPVEVIRTAAARSLAGYSDEEPLTISLSDVSTDALMAELRKRLDDLGAKVAEAALHEGGEET